MSPEQNYSIGVFILGLVFVLLEIYLGVDTAFDLVILGSVLLLGSTVGYFTDSIIITLVISSILSFVYFFIGRKFLQAKLQVQYKPSNIDAVKGKKGKVKKNISPTSLGIVSIDGEDWSARSDETIDAHEQVIVSESDGVILVVKKIK